MKVKKNFDFTQNFPNFSIKTFGKFRFQSNFQKRWIWWKMSKKFYFSQIFERFNCSAILIYQKFSKYFDITQNFEKFRLKSKFSKNIDFSQRFEQISILIKIFEKKHRLGWKFKKKMVSVSISKKFDFVQNFKKFRWRSKLSKNLDLVQNFRKISIFIKIFEKTSEKCRYLQLFRKISILVKFSNNFNFRQIF